MWRRARKTFKPLRKILFRKPGLNVVVIVFLQFKYLIQELFLVLFYPLFRCEVSYIEIANTITDLSNNDINNPMYFHIIFIFILFLYNVYDIHIIYSYYIHIFYDTWSDIMPTRVIFKGNIFNQTLYFTYTKKKIRKYTCLL